ncbi:MAG: hypothetical protein IPH26_18400 [Sterolibacteriaceae bacterium]|uniref:Uncharacterized protein n=1 Tax=Candidatus Methylophosphatis roskildensis TaxID=2899263 RepID=A0A9D7E6W3_9PROT|nr:hypothetical protein [Candidatus Methylophosphatis roskildensis]
MAVPEATGGRLADRDRARRRTVRPAGDRRSDDPLLALAIGLLAGNSAPRRSSPTALAAPGSAWRSCRSDYAQAAAIHWGRAADAPRALACLIEGCAGHEEWVIDADRPA